MSVSAALDNPKLLAPYFEGSSWATWRAVLRAAEGLPLDDDQLALFHAVADRDPPAHRVRELWVIAGRRSGKDSMASGIATVAAMGDYRAHLRPGERAVVMCLAVDRDQARIVHRYIAGFFREIPLLRPLVAREGEEEIELTNGVDIVIATNNYRAVRGRTICCALFDEVAFWRAEDTATPDVETYSAVEPGFVTLPGSMIVGISSPHRKGGLLYRKHVEAYGKADDDVLVVRGPSTTFNPSLPRRIIDAALERDPEAAAAEWLAEWRSDLVDYIDRAVVDSCVARGVHEIPPAAGVSYVGFVDPAGGSGGDSMTLGVAHAEDAGPLVLDALRERRPPFSPDDVVGEFAELLRAYGISRIHGDRWAGAWPVEAFGRVGITYEQSAAPKSDLYHELLPILNGRKAQLLDNPRLISQLCALERRVTRSGKDSIAEPSGGHDDVANAAAGALTMLAAEAEPALMKASALAAGNDDEIVPQTVGGVFAVCWVADTGLAGVVWNVIPVPGLTDREPLRVVDAALAPLRPELFDQIAARLDEIAEHFRDRMPQPRRLHAGLFVPRAFAPAATSAMRRAFARHEDRDAAERRNVVAVDLEDAVSATLLHDPVKLHFAAGSHAAVGKVRLAFDAIERDHPLPPLGGIERSGDDAVAMALWIALVLQFERGDQGGFDPQWPGARIIAA